MLRNLPYITRLAIYFLFASGLQAESPHDLVEIQSVDPTIQVELKYATADNMTGRILYPPEFKARIRRGVMAELQKAQETLRPLGYGLKVWDAYRPLSVQKALYAVVNDPRFVAAPGVHSMHNRAVAVDVTLVDADGREVEMPTKFDVMGPQAYYIYRGKNPAVIKHLLILQKVMKQSGFYACRTEWWHFFSREWEKYLYVREPDAAPKDSREKQNQPQTQPVSVFQ